MKYFLILVSLLFTQLALAQKQKEGVMYEAKLTRVIDGDTVAFQANWLPAPFKKELSVRVYGVDTPEKGFRAKCPSENERGVAATQFTKNLISTAQRTQIYLIDWDKYGGRVLGDVILDGVSLRKLLIERGYAREYYGDAKQNWC